MTAKIPLPRENFSTELVRYCGKLYARGSASLASAKQSRMKSRAENPSRNRLAALHRAALRVFSPFMMFPKAGGAK